MASAYLVLLLIQLFGSVLATDCPDRWVAFEGSCYLFGHDGISFTKAECWPLTHKVPRSSQDNNHYWVCHKHVCRQQDGHLVIVESQEENTFLKDFLSDFKEYDYWIGMTDEIDEGTWKWFETNDTVEFTDWAPGEPQNYHNEDCAVFGDPTYAWADVACDTNRKAICEMKMSDGSIIIG